MPDARGLAQPRLDLIAPHSGRGIDGAGFQAVELQVDFGAGHKEGGRQDKGVEPLKINVAAIHHVEGTGSRINSSSTRTSACLPCEIAMNAGNGAAQIQQRVAV